MLQAHIVKVHEDARHSPEEELVLQRIGRSLAGLADNMQQSVEALGPAMADLPSPVSPQSARSAAVTARTWCELEAEFGLFTSREVSARLGSTPPNGAHASYQRRRDKLTAVNRL